MMFFAGTAAQATTNATGITVAIPATATATINIGP
jgi:hypothetical protein